MRTPLPLTAAAGSPWCLRCWRRPAAWQGLVCRECAERARARRLLRRRAGVAWRWAGAGVLEGLVGLGVGALALFPLAAAGRGSPGLLVAAAMLLTSLAAAVVFAHAWLLRPVVRRWLRWAAVDGAELVGHWLLVLAVVWAAGYSPGVVAAAGVVTGVAAALLQARALAGQAAAPWRWAAGSGLIWLLAAAAGVAVELLAPGQLAAVVGGAALSRVVHGALAGPLLGLILVRR
jgi:hypothetical protein